jgi:hypothetical protein
VNVFLWIEETGLSLWVRESPSLLAFPFILFLHTLGLAMLAGISVAIDLWLLSVARIPAVSIAGLFRVMWLGFGINTLSGVALLAAYPAKALTNPVFYVKMSLVLLAVLSIEGIKREVFSPALPGQAIAVSAKAKMLAGASLLLLAGTIVTGRLLAYTHSILLSSDVW